MASVSTNSSYTGILPQEPPFWYNWSKHVESSPVFWLPLLWRSPGPHRPDMLYHRAACLTSRVLLRIVYITKKLLAKEIKAKAIIFTCLCLTSLNEKDPFYVKCTSFLMGYMTGVYLVFKYINSHNISKLELSVDIVAVGFDFSCAFFSVAVILQVHRV